MAEELARNRLALKSRKLGSCEKVIKHAIEQASDTSPTEKFLVRQVILMSGKPGTSMMKPC